MLKHCPKCFSSVQEAGVTCSSPHCNRAGIPVSPGDMEKSPRGAPLCPACKAAMTVKVCRECGFELDAGDPAAVQLAFSLVGAKGAGKSNLLAVLVNQLGGEFCKVYGATLYPTGGDRTINQYEREYNRPLFQRGVCVPSTKEEDVDPLTYTLVFPKGGEGKTCGLALYDTCGGHFRSEADMALHNRSLYHSQGLLFLVDPSQFPIPREARKAQKQPVLREDPSATLLRTIHLLRTGLGLEDVSKKIPVPVAVVVTKMDTVLPTLDPACFLRDSSRNLRRPMLSGADLSACNLETQSLLETWGGREFLGHVRSQFSHSAFFGVSALGAAPGEQNEIPRVTPHRALDPLLWLLHQCDILRAG